MTNQCLPLRRRCDKTIDCLEGDDELGCRRSSLENIFKHSLHRNSKYALTVDYLRKSAQVSNKSHTAKNIKNLNNNNTQEELLKQTLKNGLHESITEESKILFNEKTIKNSENNDQINLLREKQEKQLVNKFQNTDVENEEVLIFRCKM